jgi:methionyl-tRNA formyltransferase
MSNDKAMRNPGIVFMGTPEFAVATLDAIIREGYDVKGVVTSPDKPSGRGLQLHPSPVKEFAVLKGLPVLQPLKLKDPEFLQNLKKLNADLQVIVAFRMLPEEVWNMPPLGTFNLHASLLPQYRGAAPINWAVINGESKTGVTTFFLNHEIDKGSVLHKREIVIGENENAGNIHDRLMIIGAELVVETIRDIAHGKAKPVEQELLPVSEQLNPAPKIFKEDCRIIWNLGVRHLHNFIRGLSPYPTAWSNIVSASGERFNVKIFAASPEEKDHVLEPGSIISDRKNNIQVAASGGFIHIHQIQLQGKKQMPVADFLRGFPEINDYRFD